MKNVKEIKEFICEVGRRMYQRGYVAANDGNISVKISEKEIIITPTGVSKGFMTPEMLIKIDPEGNVLEGNLKPSSETKMHLRVYQERSDIEAVVHAHPPYGTSFAIAGQPLDKKIMPEAILLLGSVPVARYGTPSTHELPDAISDYINEYNAVLLENHGVLTWGKDLKEAYFRMESVEFYAQVMMITRELEGVRELSPENIEKLLRLKEKMG